MRYSEAHAAKSGSVPFALRGPKSVRMVLATAVAGAIGLVPAVAVSSPAYAVDTLTLNPSTASVTEGDTLSYTVKWTGTTPLSLTVGVEGVSGNPTVPADYTAPSSTLSFSGAGSKTINIKTVDDPLYELTENLTLTVSGYGDAPLTANGAIYDNDTAPSYSLSATPATVNEGRSAGTVTSKITATLSAKSGTSTVVKLDTEDGTAKASDDTHDRDYVALNGHDDVITIPAGQLSGSDLVTINNDLVKDTADTETFKVNGTATNVSAADASTTVSIVDAQAAPTLSLTQDPDNALEGADEAHSITYTVTASGKSELPMSFRWDAVAVTPDDGDDPATPGQDFTYPSSRTVTIDPGDTEATFTIPFRDDQLNENEEQFGVQLAAPANATLDPKYSQVTSTIEDNNAELAPDLTFTPTKVTEGNAGKVSKTFTATLSQKSGRTVTVEWKTTVPEMLDHNEATAGKDYVAKTGTLVFPPGTTSQTFSVDIIGDTVNEGDEDFHLSFGSEDGSANITDANALVPVTITDDDLPPTVSFDDVTMKEGEATVPVMLQVKLSNPSSTDIAFDVTDDTVAGAGKASGLYDPDTPGSGDFTLLIHDPARVTIRAGQTVAYIPLLVNGDDMYESDETASITASVVTGSEDLVTAPSSKTAKVTLLNDDKAPTLAIDSTNAAEGDTVAVTGTVQGSTDQDLDFNVSFAGGSVNGSKAADSKDFTNPGTLSATIPAGATTGDSVSIGNVSIVDDSDPEGAETIVASGAPASGGAGTVTPGTITIALSDGGATTPPVTPTISVPANVVGAVAVPITGKATAGQDVELWGAPISSAKPALVKLQTLKAGTNGAYAFSRWIGTGYRFAIKVGTWSSPEKQVTVTQDPIFAASTTKGLASFAVQGSPRAAGQTVIVQRYMNGKWSEIARGLTGSTNQWKGSVKIASGTAVAVRAFVVGNTTMGIMGGYSDIKRFTIK